MKFLKPIKESVLESIVTSAIFMPIATTIEKAAAGMETSVSVLNRFTGTGFTIAVLPYIMEGKQKT